MLLQEAQSVSAGGTNSHLLVVLLSSPQRSCASPLVCSTAQNLVDAWRAQAQGRGLSSSLLCVVLQIAVLHDELKVHRQTWPAFR